jgi:hypothetical protein
MRCNCRVVDSEEEKKKTHVHMSYSCRGDKERREGKKKKTR